MAESSTDLSSLVELSHLSQSELFTLSVSSSSHRFIGEPVAPKIDRSVFNESAGSRRQTYSRLRLVPRNKRQSSPLPAAAVRIPRPILEPFDQENSQIIALLQNLFGVESLRNGNANSIEPNSGDNSLVPVQVEFQHSLLESAALPLRSIPIDVADSSQRKRKRGWPRKDENLGIVIAEEEEPKPKRERKPKPSAEPKKVVEGVPGADIAAMMVNEKGLVVDAVALGEAGDPFGEEIKRRTQGMENKVRLLEFLEGLNGEWGSDRKKRRIVLASEFGDLLPRGWKIILILQRRADHASVICRRYEEERKCFCVSEKSSLYTETLLYMQMMATSEFSPEGHQFDSIKEVSAYLLSFFGVQDISHLKSSYTDGSQHFSSNINMAPESQGVGGAPKGDMKTDVNTSCLHLASTSIQMLHEKQATESSSIEIEKLNSYGNFNNDLTLGCKLGDTVGSAFRCHGTISCGNEQAHVDSNGNGLSVRLVEDHRQKIGFESSMLAPNPDGGKFAGNNIENRHFISSVEDMEFSDEKPTKDDSHQIIYTRDQSENKDISTIAERTCIPGGYIDNVSVTTCLQDASESGGVFVVPNLKVPEDVVTSCVRERNSSSDQRNKMDNLLMSNQYLCAFDDYVNNISAGTFDALDANKSCLSEPSQSEVKMFQTDSVDMPKFQ